MTGATMMMLGPGAILDGRFEILRVAGSGGMGVVYQARDRQSGDVVAVKVLERQEPEQRARFEREAALLRDLSHPNVVRYVAHGRETETQLYLAMEWLEGEDLERRLRGGPLGVNEIFDVGERVGQALVAAHALGLVHRDLKPANVFLVTDGTLRVLDFGLARVLSDDTRITATGWLVGTPGFMAPEQIRGGGFDARTDLFALGAVLYECASGRPAFPGKNTVELLTAVLSREPQPLTPAEAPPPLAALVTRLLAKDPDARPQTAGEVIAALGELRRSAVARTARPPARRWSRKEKRSLRVPRWFAWGVLVDSNRWNRIAGSPQTTYSLETVDGVVERVGEGELYGQKLRWIERGEWWEGSMGVGERRFLVGPFRMVRLSFRLAENASGGVEVDADILVEPRDDVPDDVATGLLEHLGARFVRYLDAVDAFAAEGRFANASASTPASLALRAQRCLLGAPRNRVLCGRPPQVDEERLSDRFGALAASGRVAKEVGDRLREVLTTFPDDLARRLRPFELADVWGLPPRDVLVGFFEATRAGLFDLRWDVLCTVCRAPATGLREGHFDGGRAHCAFCNLAFDVDVARNLEAVFAINPGVRSVNLGVYCGASPVFRPVVAGYLQLQPNEVRTDLGRLGGGAWTARRARPIAGRLSEVVEDGAPRALVAAGLDVMVRSSPEWLVENQSGSTIDLALERATAPTDAVLGAELLGLPDYLDLLLTDAAAAGLDLAASHLVLVHVELRGLDDAADRAGDSHALGALLRLRDGWDRIARSCSGSLQHVDQGTASLTFGDLTEAVRFFLLAAARLGAERTSLDMGELEVAGGLSSGPTLLLAGAGRVETFGVASRHARRLARGAPPGALRVPRAVAEDKRVAGLLRDERGSVVEGSDPALVDLVGLSSKH